MAAASDLHFQQALLEQGWFKDVRISIEDGVIAAIETSATPIAGGDQHFVGLPGLPNLHSHAFQRGMSGLAETRGSGEDSFWTWRDIMYRFVDRLCPDQLMAIAAMAYAEMLECGFTRVGEFHYLHHDRNGRPFPDTAEMSSAIMAAASETGIALTHLPVFYAHSGFGGAEPGPGQRRFLNGIDGFARLLEAARETAATLPDAIVGIAPHSLRAVTSDELGALLPLVGNGPVHIHIAEQVREVAECLEWCGARPVEWLLDHVPVDSHWCLVHATHMTESETKAMAKAGAVAGLCPMTEANLGDGIFPAEAFLSAGGEYGVGSDSNVRIDATEELRLLEYGQRLSRLGRNQLAQPGASTGATIFRAALKGGSQALGCGAELRVGAPADIVSLEAGHPSLAAHTGDALLDGLIFGGGKDAIDRVWRRGKLVVAGGRHVARDAVARRYHHVLNQIVA